MPSLAQVTSATYKGIESIMSLFGNDTSWEDQARFNAQLNYEYAQKYATNAPTWQRKGLENAGYNPMLALGNIGSGSISNITGASTSYDANSKAKNALELGALVNNVKAVKSQADLNNKQGLNIDAQTYGQAIENYYKPEILDSQINATKSDSLLKTAQRIFTMTQNNKYNELTDAQIRNLDNTGIAAIKSAVASMISAGAGVTSANASMFSATNGNPFRFAVNKASDMYKNPRKYLSAPYNFGRNIANSFFR